MVSNGAEAARVKDHDASKDDDTDVDALLASLEEEDDSAYRAQRAQQLKAEAETLRSGTTTVLDKTYITLKSDDEALRFTTEYERAIVHFCHPDFARCLSMDDHCQQIATKHSEYGNADLAFAKVDVRDAPFVVEKLGIRVLPCVIGFAKGVAKGRVTGFEGLCWDGREGSFSVTMALEEAMVNWTVLKKRLLLGHSGEDDTDEDEQEFKQRQTGRRGIKDATRQIANDEDDWD